MVTAYTDGTKQTDGKVAAGFCILTASKEIQTSAAFLGENTEVFDGELYAILIAIKALIRYYNSTCQSDMPLQKAWIFSDSQAVVKRIQSLRIGPGQETTASIWQYARKLTTYTQLTIS